MAIVRMWRVYLDVCCLTRPFDDQSQGRIRREAEAVLAVMARLQTGEWHWVSSEVVTYEVGRIQDIQRRAQVEALLDAVRQSVPFVVAEQLRVRELVAIGFRSMDSAHVACAESGGADVLLTTDDRLVRRAIRLADHLRVRVANPFVWLREVITP